MSQRACAAVLAPGAEARPGYSVIVRGPDDVSVDTLETRLGFTPHDALGVKQEVAAVLTDLAEGVRGVKVIGRPQSSQPQAVRSDPNQTLRLDDRRRNEILTRLQAVGAGLRGQMSGDMADKLRCIGFPACEGEEEPTLEFIEKDFSVPWEVFCEGSPIDDPEPDNFWGFRVPISHWQVNSSANQSIAIRNGVFSVVCSTLRGSGPEIASLVEEVERRIPNLIHRSLEEALRLRIEQDLGHRPEEVDDWLLRFLSALPSPQTPERWKQRFLVDTLRQAHRDHPLVHFACHGEGGGLTEFRSQLCFQVGGDALVLPLSLLSALKATGSSGRRMGPLVFLNACSTNQPSSGSLSFPRAWIDAGAAAVIATLCPVPDVFALAFARHFYGLLLGGGRYAYVAEALLETRRYFMHQYNNPLGLAYVLYARKGTHVVARRGP